MYNLAKDPAESTNLAGDMDLDPWREQLGVSHEMQVGPGWRLQVRLKGSEPITIKLPAAATTADVLDPESITSHPANQSWGETPKKLPEQVAVVTLSDDGQEVTISPGSSGTGTVYVLFDSPQDASEARLTRGDRGLAFDGAKWSRGSHSISFTPGTVVVPPVGEAVRIRSCELARSGTASADDMDLLKALGYVGEEGVNDPH
jgi:hypothetical protein